MTQQVVHTRVKFTTLSPLLANPSFGLTFEQLGTDTNVVLASIHTQISNFLNTLGTGQVQKMSYYLGPTLSRAANAVSLTTYDVTAVLGGGPWGSPIDVYDLTLGAGAAGTDPFPEGIALCVGLRAAYGSDTEFGPGDRPRARDRNRFYFGPLGSETITNEGTTNRCIWSNGFITDFTHALPQLWSPNAGGSADVTSPVQWSRKNAMVKQIVTVQSDDAPRFQRRRDKAKGTYDYGGL